MNAPVSRLAVLADPMIQLSHLRTMKTLSAQALAAELGPFVFVQRPAPRAPVATNQTLVISAAERTATLSILDSGSELTVVTAVSRGEMAQYIIGRSPVSDVVIANASVSSRHAVLKKAFGRWQLTDAGSRNGTRVNNMQVTGSQFFLTDGDLVAFGEAAFSFLTTGGLKTLLDKR